MVLKEIKPSNIFYSHDSIMYRFKKQKIGIFRRKMRYGGIRSIGETLDALCDGSCKVSDIPKITITKKDGKWYTLDNRRLWVFHHYEAYLNSEGKSLTITADIVEYNPSIHDGRFTTKNGGKSIDIKSGNSPWGKKKIEPVIPQVEEQNDERKECGTSVALEKHISDTEKETPYITAKTVDDSSVSNDKNASFTKINEAGLSTSHAITDCENIAPTDTDAGTTDKNSAPSDKTAEEMSTPTVKIAATTDNNSALSDDTTYNNGESLAPGDKTTDTNGEILVSTDTTVNTTDEILPACTATGYKGDILSFTDTTTGNTNKLTTSEETSASTSREMLATIDTNAMTMDGISAQACTIAVSTDESSSSDETADANGGASEHINTTEGTTKYEIPLSELVKMPHGSETEENQTGKREFPENNKQFSDDHLKVKRLKPTYE